MKDIDKIEDELEDYYFRGKPMKDTSPASKRQSEEEQKDEEINIFREILSTLLYIFAAFFVAFVFTNFVGERTLVSGSSMERTLSHGDQLYLDKLSYRFHDPERFDIVVFPYGNDTVAKIILPFRKSDEVSYIKRIIGLPGETLYISQEGDIYINGEILEEHYGFETIREAGVASAAITLGPDEYFVMGDNRNNSKDSRVASVGNIHRRDIIGKVRARIYPFNKIGSVYK